MATRPPLIKGERKTCVTTFAAASALAAENCSSNFDVSSTFLEPRHAREVINEHAAHDETKIVRWEENEN
jgi:hypothetical protein